MSTEPNKAIRPPQRLGLFGGSFDPIHRGHRLMAETALEQAGLDAVWFIPAAQSPLKGSRPQADDHDRLAMIRAAIRGRPKLNVWEGELQLPPPSYSLRTVEAIRAEQADTDLYWLLGADQFTQLEQWWRIEKLVELVRFLVCVRPGSVVKAPALPGLRWQAIENEPIDLASSQIRERIQTGKSVDNQLDPDVFNWIKHKQLYGYSAQ
ncbi:MAG: nicotinate (nicotinamide) nucleotide adenylyltransferase [Opitutales bacterium]|nr:nicotinate (nicotinamide) nucleotide adenylyltransferase [Opitutales bacterium]